MRLSAILLRFELPQGTALPRPIGLAGLGRMKCYCKVTAATPFANDSACETLAEHGSNRANRGPSDPPTPRPPLQRAEDRVQQRELVRRRTTKEVVQPVVDLRRVDEDPTFASVCAWGRGGRTRQRTKLLPSRAACRSSRSGSAHGAASGIIWDCHAGRGGIQMKEPGTPARHFIFGMKDNRNVVGETQRGSFDSRFLL